MLRLARFSDPGWQTTRVLPPFGSALRADASERAFGTAPPAAGLTDVSGAGFGQYEVRSTCAIEAPGIASAIEAAGGVRTRMETWTEAGWIVDPGAPPNLCVRRSTLDPLLRRVASETPGVEPMLGTRVTELLTEGGTACGVVA